MLAAALALSAPSALADVPFRITTEAGPFEVTRWAPPPLAVLPLASRTCRLSLSLGADGVRAAPIACSERVRAEAVAALAAWEIRGPTGDHDLGEVWFVYPHEVGPDVTVLVRQSTDHALELPPGVNAAPFAIRAWSYLRYPPSMLETGARGTCAVDVLADVQGRATAVEATGCPLVFREAATDAVRQWRFEPPVLHGAPLETALTLTTTFDPTDAVRDEAPAPEASRESLWTSRQFGDLTRAERLYFIKASLLGDAPVDLGPGQVHVRLPATADLGSRDAGAWFDADSRGSSPPDLPSHGPLLVLKRDGRSEIEIYDAPRPTLSDLGRSARCRLLVQVDGNRHVLSWPEACDEPVRVASMAAVDAWIVRHTGEARLRERFGVTLEFDVDGASRAFFDADEVRTPPDALPVWAHLRRPARAVHRVPPRLPAEVAEQGLPDADCRLAVRVTHRGKPTNITPVDCPTTVVDAAVRAVKRWRWSPAIEDGEPVPEHLEVSIRFGR